MVDPKIIRNVAHIERCLRIVMAMLTAFALIYPQFAQAATNPRSIRQQVQDVVRNRQQYNQSASASTQREQRAQESMEQNQVPINPVESAPVDPNQLPVHLRPAEPPTASEPPQKPDEIIWSGVGGWVSVYRRDGQLYLALFKKVPLSHAGSSSS